MKQIEVRDMKICKGITGAARELGVSYVHLWKVLSGSYASPSLVLKINKFAPALFKSAVCKIDYKSIIKEASKVYCWNEVDGRFHKKHTLTRFV